MKVKNDHRSKFSNLSNWKEEAWKKSGLQHSSLSSTTAVQKWIISYTSHYFTPPGRYELSKLTSLPMCGFIAQLVEQHTSNAEVTGSNPFEALIFFRLLLSNCLNWKIYCDDHSSLSITTAVQKWIISYTSHYFTPHRRYELNILTSLPMCGFIAQLVEQRTGNEEVMGSNPVEALIFFRLLLSNCLNWKIYCDDHSSLSYCVSITSNCREALLCCNLKTVSLRHLYIILYSPSAPDISKHVHFL